MLVTKQILKDPTCASDKATLVIKHIFVVYLYLTNIIFGVNVTPLSLFTVWPDISGWPDMLSNRVLFKSSSSK